MCDPLLEYSSPSIMWRYEQVGRFDIEQRALRYGFVDAIEELYHEVDSLHERSAVLESDNTHLKAAIRHLKLMLDAKERFVDGSETHDEKEALRDENVCMRQEIKRLERLISSRGSSDSLWGDSLQDSGQMRSALKSSFKSSDVRDDRQIQFSRQSIGEDGRMSKRHSLPSQQESGSTSLTKRVSLDAPPSPVHKKAPMIKLETASLVMNAVKSLNAGARRTRSKQSLFSTQSSFVSTDGSYRFVPIERMKDSERIAKLVSVMSQIEACQSQDLVAVARAMAASRVTEGDTVCKQGDPGLYFAIIEEGEFLMESIEIPSRDLKPNDFIGEAIFIHPFPMSPSSVTCISPQGAVVWTIHTDVLRQVMREVAMRQSSIGLSDVRMGRTIGRGGTAVVKLASVPKEEDPSRFYALKIIKKRLLEKHNKLNLLQNERYILSQLDSPYIIRLRTSFKDARYIYFLLELAPGGDLLTVLNNIGVLTRSQAQFYTACIFSALEHCHARGVIYRDLKPENLLVDAQGYLKLTDFGVAKKLSQETTYSLVGTPQFMAPEVILGRGYGTQADWWSLGCCVYEFLTGDLPFQEEANQYELFQKIIRFDPELSQQLQNINDADCKDFVRNLLEPNPNNRLGKDQSIKTHAFFNPMVETDDSPSQFSWPAFAARSIKPPFEPVLRPLSSSANSDAVSLSDDMTSASPALSAVSWTSFKDTDNVFI